MSNCGRDVDDRRIRRGFGDKSSSDQVHAFDVDIQHLLKFSSVSVLSGRGPLKYPAFVINKSIFSPPNCSAILEKAFSISAFEEMSALAVNTWVLFPEREMMVEAAAERTLGRRPMIASLETPARARDLEIARPMPEPPPVMTAVFPARESSRRAGEMLG